MEQLGRYILSVITAAMLLGILKSFLKEKNGPAAVVGMMGGLFLTFTILSPASKFDFSGIDLFFESFSMDGQAAAAYGEKLAQEELEGIIKSQVEAYILDKAKPYRAELSVEVTLDEATVPTAVRLQGDISPYGKMQLQQMLEADLGIAKENQQWIE